MTAPPEPRTAERCQVQDCPNDHQWFYGPGLYLCNEHVRAIEAEAADTPLREALANELLDAIKGVLDFERVNSVIAGPYDRLRLAYNAVVKEANRAALTATPAPAPAPLDVAYAERNSLVAALTHLFANAAWRGIDPDAPEFTVVYIDLPTGQVSWHIPDAEMMQFPPLPLRDPTGWDGHDTAEKYRRLAALRRGDICRDVQDAVERTVARLTARAAATEDGE